MGFVPSSANIKELYSGLYFGEAFYWYENVYCCCKNESAYEAHSTELFVLKELPKITMHIGGKLLFITEIGQTEFIVFLF